MYGQTDKGIGSIFKYRKNVRKNIIYLCSLNFILNLKKNKKYPWKNQIQRSFLRYWSHFFDMSSHFEKFTSAKKSLLQKAKKKERKIPLTKWLKLYRMTLMAIIIKHYALLNVQMYFSYFITNTRKSKPLFQTQNFITVNMFTKSTVNFKTLYSENDRIKVFHNKRITIISTFSSHIHKCIHKNIT